ncbi:MAG: hypothetical protein ACXIT9_01175 [Nitritalea sp.]
MDFTEEDKQEALQQIRQEWNQFRPPAEIDAYITNLFYEDKEEFFILRAMMHEFELLECYARKCYWFSSANSDIREREEARGAFYNSGACVPSCIPKRFRQEGPFLSR